ncbi:MAG TPA: SGNH/GDSL hydrolase family protein, partial [Myxococcota bacterium]|nr:SGNH/GDSL hydrolase family protein [Myxococcota bacterium]
TGLLLLVATGEAAVRVINPAPRAQVVREGAPGRPGYLIVERNGQPTWAEHGSDERRNDACQRPDTIDVVMFGSSITYGTGYAPGEVMSAFLQRDLDAIEPGRWCVHNYGQAAYTGWSKLAEATDVLPRIQPEIVVWELWGNDAGRFRKIGPDWYNLDGLDVDERGVPRLVPLPAALNEWLFLRSRFYAYTALALAPLEPGGVPARWERHQREFVPAFDALIAANPTRVLFMVPSLLDSPFAELARRPSLPWDAMRGWAEAHHAPAVSLAAELVGDDPAVLRHDLCCHFNPVGHERVAEVLLPHVRARLAGPRSDEP